MIACAQALAARRDLDVVLVTGAAGESQAPRHPQRARRRRRSFGDGEICEPGAALGAAGVLAGKVLDKPKHSVLMQKEAVNAYAGLGAHAVSYMAADQLELAAASPESRAARASALQRRKK